MQTLIRAATIHLSERKAPSDGDGLKRFPVTLSTETPVPRRDFYGQAFNEVLSHSPSAVDLSRAVHGLPVIESHDARKVNVGKVERLQLEGGKLRGVLVLGKSARAKELADDIEAKIVSGVSIGYVVNEIPDEGATRVASRWTPYELSIVSLPADINAGIGRSSPTTGEDPMFKRKKLQEQEDGNGGGGATPSPEVLRERARVSGIQSAVRAAKLGDDLATRMISEGVSLDRARAIVLERLAEHSDSFGINSHVRVGRVTGGETSSEKFVRGASAWIFEKGGITAVEQARRYGAFNDLSSRPEHALDPGEFRGMSLLDLARESLERNGVRTRGMSRQDVVGRAFVTRGGGYHGKSDFAILLEDAIGKILLGSYATAEDTWSKFCKTELVPDFRDSPRYRVGSFGALPVVTEHGEYVNQTIPDGAKTVINTETKGGIIALSRQAIINDDMGVFKDLATRLGRGAKLTIEQEVYALLAQNGGLGPTQSDANPFFHSSRGNVNGTGSALGVEGIDADRVIMSAQKDPSGNDYLDLRPAILLVSSALGGAARVLNGAQYDVTASSAFQTPNRVKGLFREVVDTARISGKRRYLFADPQIAPAIVVAFLEGSGTGPYLEQQQGWRVDGTEWKVRLDAKAHMFDPKGAITNAGQ